MSVDDEDERLARKADFVVLHREAFLRYVSRRRRQQHAAAQRETTLTDRVLEFARRIGGPFTVAEAIEQLNHGRNHINRVLHELEARGMVRPVGTAPRVGSHGPQPTRWQSIS